MTITTPRFSSLLIQQANSLLTQNNIEKAFKDRKVPFQKHSVEPEFLAHMDVYFTDAELERLKQGETASDVFGPTHPDKRTVWGNHYHAGEEAQAVADLLTLDKTPPPIISVHA